MLQYMLQVPGFFFWGGVVGDFFVNPTGRGRKNKGSNYRLIKGLNYGFYIQGALNGNSFVYKVGAYCCLCHFFPMKL